MKILSSCCLLFLYLEEVTPSLLSIASSVFEWTADLGSQMPGITPLFAKFSDGVALASIVQGSGEQFYLNVSTFDVTGDRRATCEVPLLPLASRVWNTRLTYLGEARVGATWLFNDKHKLESGLRLTIVYLDDCAHYTVTVSVHKDIDFVYHVPYAVVPYQDGLFDVFVKSPTVCGHGVCKIGFKTAGQQIVKNGEAISFMNDDDLLSWTIVPVKPYSPSEGFYQFGLSSNEGAASAIKKLSPTGTILNSAEARQLTGDEVIGCSNVYGNFGLCSSGPASGVVRCSLFDAELTEKLGVSVPVERPVRKIGVGNDNKGGLLLLLNSCLSEHCFDHVTLARKISANGELGDAAEFASSRPGCYPRNNYDLIVDEKENVYCTGAPCMRKTAGSAAYDVSAHVKCLKHL